MDENGDRKYSRGEAYSETDSLGGYEFQPNNYDAAASLSPRRSDAQRKSHGNFERVRGCFHGTTSGSKNFGSAIGFKSALADDDAHQRGHQTVLW